MITFRTETIRVPASRVVKIPKRYAHEFASMPIEWREVVVPQPSKFLSYPTLDPAAQRHLNRSLVRGGE